MDKTEKFLKDELDRAITTPDLDVDDMIKGTHLRIARRSRRRKTLYSAPVVLLLLSMVYVIMPSDSPEQYAAGDELFMAGWELSWTDNEVITEESIPVDLYDEAIDYLLDENYYGYADEVTEMLEEADLETLYGLLKEA